MTNKHLTRPGRLRGETTHLTERLQAVQEKYERIQNKITAYKKLLALKREHTRLRQEYKRKVKVLLRARKDLEELKQMNSKSDLIDFDHKMSVNADEVLLYASKISNFVQAPPDYSTDQSQLFPWSFGMNKVEALEFESSGLYFMYKNNYNYDVCSPPGIVYINNSEKNIDNFEQKGPFEFSLTVRGYLNLKPEVAQSGESFVYTLDGSTPNKFTLKEPQNDLIDIQESSTLKIRSFMAGRIDSPVMEFEVEVVEGVEGGDMAGFANMARPEENGLNSEDRDNFEDLFNGAGFSSFHDQGVFLTPKTYLGDSTLNTPLN